jgi:hypothetical protein
MGPIMAWIIFLITFLLAFLQLVATTFPPGS